MSSALRHRGDTEQSSVLESWLVSVEREYRERILPITTEIADTRGRLNARRPLPPIDSLMAATAMTHGLTFVTRDRRDVAGLGVDVLNPFEA